MSYEKLNAILIEYEGNFVGDIIDEYVKSNEARCVDIDAIIPFAMWCLHNNKFRNTPIYDIGLTGEEGKEPDYNPYLE